LCTSELMEFMEISVSQGASQGASQGRSFLARAFDLARPGVAPPLRQTDRQTVWENTLPPPTSAEVITCTKWCAYVKSIEDSLSTVCLCITRRQQIGRLYVVLIKSLSQCGEVTVRQWHRQTAFTACLITIQQLHNTTSTHAFHNATYNGYGNVQHQPH